MTVGNVADAGAAERQEAGSRRCDRQGEGVWGCGNLGKPRNPRLRRPAAGS